MFLKTSPFLFHENLAISFQKHILTLEYENPGYFFMYGMLSF